MGGDDWSFLDEECAKLEKKGGKKGGARGGRRGGQGDGGHRARAVDDGLQNNDGKVDEGAGLDEWSALDDELARIERKGKGGGGDVTPAREDPRRDPSPPSATPPSSQRPQQQQEPPKKEISPTEENPVAKAAKMAERAARFANDASTRAEHAASNAADLKSRLGPPTPAPAKSNKPITTAETRERQNESDTAVVDEDERVLAGHTVGTCESMCPDAERADRERNREIELFERIEPNDPSVSNAQLCVKKFSRIVDNPHCSSIRTRAALDKTCAHLYGLLGGRCDYPDGDVSLLKRSNFLWDRLRSVRQDMGLTGLLCGEWAATRLEEMARFAIAAEYLLCENVATSSKPDGHNSHLHIEQLGKTLTTLNAVYDETDEGERSPSGKKLGSEKFQHRAEMTCYSLLLRMDDHGPFRASAAQFLRIVRSAPVHIQRSNEVQFALDVRAAYAENNAPAFFALVKSKRCSYLQACLLHKYFDALRLRSLECVNTVMNKSPLAMETVAKDVLFEESVDVATQLCESCGLAVTKNEGESAWLRVKESGFTTPAVGTSVSRRRERWVERKAPAIKSANMFRWQALITGKVGV